MLAQNRRPRSHAQDHKTNTPPKNEKQNKTKTTELNYTIGVILIISCLKKL